MVQHTQCFLMHKYSMRIYPSGRQAPSQIWKLVSTPTTFGYLCQICHKWIFSLILFLLGVCFLSPPSVFRAVAFFVAFRGASAFNADLSKWQTGAVTNINSGEYTNLCVVTFVECSQVLFLSLTLFLLAVCSLSPPSVFRAVAFVCSFLWSTFFQCGYIQVADGCCHKYVLE